MAAVHCRPGRVKPLEYFLELVVGGTGVLALKGDGSDVERGHRGGELFGSAFGALTAVAAGDQRAAKNKAHKGQCKF
ncbi:hypothetical protein SRABI128_04655 [Microbacterium sp. Bi128]|nr:hypothetical protein SRABI128_04655 [Microbacterium sp. Bi128]